MGVVCIVTRMTSNSYVKLGKSNFGMGEEEKDSPKDKRGAQCRSKAVGYNEPTHLKHRMRDPQVSKVVNRSFRSRDLGQELRSARPSKWTRFWRKLSFDGGKRIPVARPVLLNYDSRSYAMNFEKDVDTNSFTYRQMPKVSGPGAREIVTVLLTRSSTSNRNSGAILIPKPVICDVKQETNLPLWKRRSISAPAPIDVRMRRPDIKRRRGAIA